MLTTGENTHQRSTANITPFRTAITANANKTSEEISTSLRSGVVLNKQLPRMSSYVTEFGAQLWTDTEFSARSCERLAMPTTYRSSKLTFLTKVWPLN